jgi:hypothetical protein
MYVIAALINGIMTLTLWKSENLLTEEVLVKRNGHSWRAMVINNKLMNFAGNEMQIYSNN